jgi:hypothetical protein
VSITLESQLPPASANAGSSGRPARRTAELLTRGSTAAFLCFVGYFLPWSGLSLYGGPINLVWGDICGVGFYFAFLLSGGVRPGFVGVVGLFLWPFLVTVFIFLLSGMIWRLHSPVVKWAIAGLLLISLCFNISWDAALKPAFNYNLYHPLFSNGISAFY